MSSGYDRDIELKFLNTRHNFRRKEKVTGTRARSACHSLRSHTSAGASMIMCQFIMLILSNNVIKVKNNFSHLW